MRSNSREIPLYLLSFFLSICLIFLDSKLFLNPIKSQVQNVLMPIFSTLEKTNSLGTNIFSQEIKNKDLIIQELENKNSSLLAKVAQEKNLEEENSSMRRLLGAQIPASWKFEPARKLRYLGDEIFLTSEVDPPSRAFVLATQEENSKSGIYVGYTKGQIGKLTQVLLPTHPESKLSAVIRRGDNFEQKSTGILEGRGGRALLTQVLISDQIEVDDLVMVSASDDTKLGLQTELLVGRISKVLESQNSAFKQAEIELAFNPRELDYVFYLTKK